MPFKLLFIGSALPVFAVCVRFDQFLGRLHRECVSNNRASPRPKSFGVLSCGLLQRGQLDSSIRSGVM